MNNKPSFHTSNLLALTTACLALTAFGCTKSDSLGKAGNDSGADSGKSCQSTGANPSTCDAAWGPEVSQGPDTSCQSTGANPSKCDAAWGPEVSQGPEASPAPDATPDADSAVCRYPNVFYTAPGCGSSAVSICGDLPQDACPSIEYYCGCDGQTNIEVRCGISFAPFLHAGACAVATSTSDGGVDSVPDSGGCDARTYAHYATPGCGADAVFACISAFDASPGTISSYCGCDGVTTLSYDTRLVRSPYLYAGACKPDGGPGALDVAPDGNDSGNPDGYRSLVDTMPDGADCGGGRYIHYTTPGCGAQAVPLCEAPTLDACAAIRWYCSCDGVTGVIGGCGTSNVPYLYEGACRSDAGTILSDAAPSD
jgi:hypothetical protein